MKKPTPKPWEDKKVYKAMFRKYICIGEHGEEHYDVIDMEIEAQRAVRRITDHQEIVKQYQKVVRAYNNFMQDYPWKSPGGLIQDNCWFGYMLKDEKRKSQFKYELGRLMGEYAVTLPLGNFNLSNRETRRLELWNNQRGIWFDHIEHMEEGPEKNKEWENFWWTVDEDMFTHVIKTRIEEIIEAIFNQEFPEEVETRENQDFESDEEMTSDTEETDDYSEPNNENVNNYLDSANMATNLESTLKIAEEEDLWIGDSGASSLMMGGEEHVFNKKLTSGSVRTANGAHMKMLCEGGINVDVITKNGDVTSGTLRVKVIPGMKQKLFSFTQAMLGGWSMQSCQAKQGELFIALTMRITNLSFLIKF